MALILCGSIKPNAQTLVHSEDFEGTPTWSTVAGTGCSSYPFMLTQSIAQSGIVTSFYPSYTAPKGCFAFFYSPTINVTDAGPNDSMLVKFYIYRDNSDAALDRLEWNILDSNDQVVIGPSPVYRYYQYTPAGTAIGWVEIHYKTPLSPLGTAKNLKLRYAVTGISDNGQNIFLDNIRVYHIKKLPPATITVVKPNGGETLSPSNNYNITWTSSNVANVNIDFSINGGLNWANIAQNVSAVSGSYSWTIPSAASTTCKVRISDAANAATSDESDAYFTIAPVSLVLTNPNGGNQLDWRVPFNITWTSSNIGVVNLQFTINGGVNWLNIASNVPAANLSYTWTIPKTPSATCKIKISNGSDPTENDESDAYFTIKDVASILDNAPGNENPFVYPNPSSGVLNFDLPAHIGGALTVRIYSPSGQLIYSENLEGKTQIDLGKNQSFSAGIYFVALSDGDKTWRQKLVLNQ